MVLKHRTGMLSRTVATVAANTRIYLGAHVAWISGTGALLIEALENGLHRQVAVVYPSGLVHIGKLNRVTDVLTVESTQQLDPRLAFAYVYITFIANGTGALSLNIRGTLGDSVWLVDDVIYGPNNLTKSITLPDNGDGKLEFLRSFTDEVDGLLFKENRLSRDLDHQLRRSGDIDQLDRDDYVPRTPRIDNI